MDPTGYTIKAVSDRTGVSVHTLRAWERRYGVPSPNRGADNRYRLYDEHDIADVLFLKQQVENGITPSQASLLLRQQQNHLIAPMADAHQPVIEMQTALLDAFVRSDETAAREMLDRAFAAFTSELVALEIIEPTLHAIGDKWLRSEMTVWQEHLASNVIQQKLFAVLQSQPALSAMSPQLVAACAPSEEHQIGLTIFALLARRQGWRVSYLGQGTPLADLIDLARKAHPNVIVISITTVVGLASLIPWFDAKNLPATPVVIGGRLPNQLPGLREHLPGDYLGDDTLAAVRNLASIKRRTDFWTPTKRVRSLTQMLQALRLKIAGDVVVEFMASLSTNVQRKWSASNINYATMFLVDALSCALAFDVPDLMDLQREWLNKAMPSHAVSPQLIAKHLYIFETILRKNFSVDQLRLLSPLIGRMQNHVEN